jgi:hypothetical protein
MKRFPLILGLLAVLILVLAFSAPALAAGPADAPNIKVKQGTSSNWSGYAVLTNLTSPQAGAVTSVSGTWVVPSVSGTGTAYSSAWVGIDGDGSNTVEQIGTDQDIVGGVAQYYAWYEMYPKYPVNLTNFPVKPGDKITASVTYLGKTGFKLTITNSSNNNKRNNTFTTTQKCPSSKRLSAEWIMEAPWSSGVLPLANFGTVDFSNCTATLNGVTGPIGSSSWQNDQINMVNSSGAVKAQTGNLSNSLDDFSVTWVSGN